jgi:endonuclease/exonuclease/phosphatase family metal-dependent hydrolase
LTTTFNLKRKGSSGGWAKATVDKMFVSKNIKISEHYCPKADVSDHLPLVCVVDL